MLADEMLVPQVYAALVRENSGIRERNTVRNNRLQIQLPQERGSRRLPKSHSWENTWQLLGTPRNTRKGNTCLPQ